MKHDIPIASPFIDQADKKAVMQVLDSRWLSLGPRHIEFEEKFAKYLGVKYGCSVANGTCGLHVAVKALGLKAGDEVITSPFSFISSTNCLLFEGVKPVFVDVDETTYNLRPDLIEAKITKKTKAILTVDIFGQSANMKPIKALAKKYKLKILEDACESLGSTYQDQQTGSLADISVFAFYPNKQMTTGEGGMVISNSKKLIELCKSLRNQGRDANNNWLKHVRLGFNYRLDEMSAALGISQLDKLDWMIKQKQKIANWYSAEFINFSQVITPQIASGNTHSWFVYVIRVPSSSRNKLINHLEKKGIQTKPYLPVIHLQPYIKKQFGFKRGDFPVAEKISSQTIALPLFIGLKKEQVKLITEEIKNFLAP